MAKFYTNSYGNYMTLPSQSIFNAEQIQHTGMVEVYAKGASNIIAIPFTWGAIGLGALAAITGTAGNPIVQAAEASVVVGGVVGSVIIYYLALTVGLNGNSKAV